MNSIVSVGVLLAAGWAAIPVLRATCRLLALGWRQLGPGGSLVAVVLTGTLGMATAHAHGDEIHDTVANLADGAPMMGLLDADVVASLVAEPTLPPIEACADEDLSDCYRAHNADYASRVNRLGQLVRGG